MLFLSLLLASAVDPVLVGIWDAPFAGMQMSLVIDANGRCTLESDAFSCRSKDGTLTLADAQGSATYNYTLRGSTLTLSGGDMESPILFTRRSGSQGTPAKTAPQPGASPSTPPASEGPAREAGKRGSFQQPAWGATFEVPGGWKAGERDGAVLLGSDTEAGLIVVRFFPAATREGLIAQYQQGLHEDGIRAEPVTAAAAFTAKGGAGLAGELRGADQHGNAIAVRTVAVLTRFGGALTVTGLTSTAAYATLKERTDAVAASATFREPPRAKGLAGRYTFIYVSKSGSYSREASLALCRSGRFSKQGELSGSGASGQGFTARSNSGTWTAVGGEQRGTLTLTFDDGSVVDVPYAVSANPADRSSYGPGVRFGDDLYQRSGDGGC